MVLYTIDMRRNVHLIYLWIYIHSALARASGSSRDRRARMRICMRERVGAHIRESVDSLCKDGADTRYAKAV